MGMDADVFVIGPFKILREANALEYPTEFYKGTADEAEVLGSMAAAEGNLQSQELAEICGVSPWDLGNHRILKPVLPKYLEGIEDTETLKVYQSLVYLLQAGCQVWYRPNG